MSATTRLVEMSEQAAGAIQEAVQWVRAQRPRRTGIGQEPVLDAEPGLIPVILAKTDGTDGNGTIPVSWVYTVTHAISGVELGTGISPEHNRSLARTVPATRGVAWMEGETVHLILTDEIPNFGPCSE